MGALILDANVLIGLLDAGDAHHERAIADVEAADLAARALVLPASAYSEVLVAFARADRTAEARRTIAAVGITVEPLDADTAARAAELRARHRHLRLPDAMVLAAATPAGRDLLTYDTRLAKLTT